jgi:hypothetical protein
MDLTISRFAAGIVHSWAPESIFLPAVKGVDSPNVKLLDTVPRLKPGPAEITHTLDHGGQACSHRWFCPLVFDEGRIQELVLLRWRIVHIY